MARPGLSDPFLDLAFPPGVLRLEGGADGLHRVRWRPGAVAEKPGSPHLILLAAARGLTDYREDGRRWGH